MATNSTTVKLTIKIASLVMRLLLNVLFYILIVILVVNVSKLAFDFTYQLYGPVTVDKAPGNEIIVQIKKGEKTMDVASKLELNLLIKNKYSFYLKTKLQNSVIMPGIYKLNSSMTYEEILKVITDYAQADSGTDSEKGTQPATQ